MYLHEQLHNLVRIKCVSAMRIVGLAKSSQAKPCLAYALIFMAFLTSLLQSLKVLQEQATSTCLQAIDTLCFCIFIHNLH